MANRQRANRQLWKSRNQSKGHLPGRTRQVLDLAMSDSIQGILSERVFEAKKRFGLSVLNYMVTSNHVHLLVKDTGGGVTA